MNLKTLLFNVQDLFIFMDKYKGEDIDQLNNPQWQLLTASFYPNKDLDKIIEIKKIIQNNDPDIVMLVEVGGLESLNNFNQYFLKNQYKPYMAPSNSNRGIDVGYLVKNQAQLNVKFKSYTKDKLSNGNKLSRGLFELKVMDEKNVLKAFFYLTHLKSKLDLEKKDFEGRNQRDAEVKYICEKIKDHRIKFPGIPHFICGDLNGIIFQSQTEPELRTFAQYGFKDVLEHLNLAHEERITYYYFDKSHNKNGFQLDYFLIHNSDQNCIQKSSKVLAFDHHYCAFPPDTLKEKLKMPSDHMPLWVELKL